MYFNSLSSTIAMESGIWKGKNFTNYPLSKKNPSIKTQTRSKSNNKFYDRSNSPNI